MFCPFFTYLVNWTSTESQDNVTILSSQEDPSSWLQASNQSVIGESHNVAENAKLNERYKPKQIFYKKPSF